MIEPNIFIQQFEATINEGSNAVVDEDKRSQIWMLAQAVAVALETLFEAMQRIAYSLR